MRIVFMGTPDFAVPTLAALLGAPDMQVVAVITQPDRPAGRGNKLRQSPVKQLALQHELPVFQPEKLRGKDVMAQLRTYEPDFHVVAAYGQILRQAVLDLPTHGSINVHASLLPRWRGAAPIQSAIMAGDAESGITIMQMGAGLDTGPMLGKAAIPIEPDETGQSLHDKLAALGGPLLISTLQGLVDGSIQPKAQNDDNATYAPRIQKDDGRMDWNHSAAQIDRQVRAFFPWPGTFTHWNGQMLKIIRGEVVTGRSLSAGKVAVDKDYALLIGCGDGNSFAPTEIQLAGRKAMPAQDFVNGFNEIDGATFGD
jgi:methionyl-tRNA formyltransferase